MAEVQLRFTAKKPAQKVLSLKATCSGPFQKNQELITLEQIPFSLIHTRCF